MRSLLKSRQEITPLLMVADMEHLSSSGVGPNQPGNVPGETSAELPGPLPHSFSSGSEGEQNLFTLVIDLRTGNRGDVVCGHEKKHTSCFEVPSSRFVCDRPHLSLLFWPHNGESSPSPPPSCIPRRPRQPRGCLGLGTAPMWPVEVEDM